jgi:hypothetical protein
MSTLFPSPLRLAFLIFTVLTTHRATSAEVPLFDGKTLDGWEGNRAVWRIEDGAITGGSMQGNPHNEFLATTKPYRNFILRLECRIVGSEGFVNGGVQFHSVRLQEPAYEMIGYQADAGPDRSGNLYDESRRKKALVQADKALVAKIEKPGDWNRYKIRCEGPHIRITLNDRLVADYQEEDPSIPLEGLIALQIHGDNKAVASYRNISIEVLPEDPGTRESGMPGGFSVIQDHDAQALAAAKYAVTAHDQTLGFEGIEKVEQQIVAGTNYRMTLKVSDKGKERRAEAVVWRKLDGQHAITSWKWLEGAPTKSESK